MWSDRPPNIASSGPAARQHQRRDAQDRPGWHSKCSHQDEPAHAGTNHAGHLHGSSARQLAVFTRVKAPSRTQQWTGAPWRRAVRRATTRRILEQNFARIGIADSQLRAPAPGVGKIGVRVRTPHLMAKSFSP